MIVNSYLALIFLAILETLGGCKEERIEDCGLSTTSARIDNNIDIDIDYAGNMNTARYASHLVTIITDNLQRIFALCGFDGGYSLDSHEELDPESYTCDMEKS